MGASEIRNQVRSAAGLTLFPLPYVSHAWRDILAVYADLTTVPKRQVLALEPSGRHLRGFDGAWNSTCSAPGPALAGPATLPRWRLRPQVID